MRQIDAAGRYYRDVNAEVRDRIEAGETEFTLNNVLGHRYIGAGLSGSDVCITVNGTPGNDLAAFMNGPTIVVHGNAQDGVANTMGAGTIVVHGNAGDALGYGMRGGQVYIRGNAGYRIGIHMKSYQDNFPIVVVGGGVGDYCGEYMAGGILVVLGLGDLGGRSIVGDFIGTGMHGGKMYVRGQIGDVIVGKEVGTNGVKGADEEMLEKVLSRFAEHFGVQREELLEQKYLQLWPVSVRPYGKIYVY